MQPASRHQMLVKHESMQVNACNSNGPLPTAAMLAAALTDKDYQGLTAFAALRLRRLVAISSHHGLLAMTEPADLVHQAVFKVLLGDSGYPAGRRLSLKNRTSTEAFILCLKGIINSDLSTLAKRPENRVVHSPIGEASTESDVVDPATAQDQRRLLELRDLHRALFAQLRQTADRSPATQWLLEQWEKATLSDDRLPSSSASRHCRRKLQAQMKQALAGFARELGQGTTDGKEMIL
jgi:hypothetical protein